MSFFVQYHPDVKKEDIPAIPKNFLISIKTAIEERLMTDPLEYGEPLRKSLKGYRKLRVGNYRIIYFLRQKDVVILKIGHRKDVYEKVSKRAG